MDLGVVAAFSVLVDTVWPEKEVTTWKQLPKFLSLPFLDKKPQKTLSGPAAPSCQLIGL